MSNCARARVLVLVAVFLLFASPADAFDGQRRGVVFGVGLGGGLFGFSQSVGLEKSPWMYEGTFVTDFRIGGGVNDELVLFYHSRTAWFGIVNVFEEAVTVASGVNGLGLIIHPHPETNEWYFTGTLGVASWGAPFEAGVDTWWGFGAEIAVGWEFTPHWAGELSVAFGTPDETEGRERISTDFYSAALTLVGMAY